MNRNLAVPFLALSATAVSSSATADGSPHGFIGYRHEYLDKDAKYYYLVMMRNFLVMASAFWVNFDTQ
ncbi:hypothetical protein [Vibrio mediterranei]|uniref:hypothetical protein n=1 Tax=Vibrio mediterranei TaxID=689 RepID=UPI0022834050|nr:hypothetical protein [Vibrio mediterranei]MCY9855965.1 hypothetical protein [Vibrio mediterranei]